jgi:hypothetical protein
MGADYSDEETLAYFVSTSDIFLPTFVRFEKLLEDPTAPRDDKESALKALSRFLPLAGPHLRKLWPKVIAFLKHTMKKYDFGLECADVYLSFVISLDQAILVENRLLTQIVVDLLPYVGKGVPTLFRSCVIRVLNHLIVNPRRSPALADQIGELPKFPNDPEFALINKTIEAEHGRPHNFWQKLNRHLFNVQHPSPDVQNLALDSLSRLLRENQERLVQALNTETELAQLELVQQQLLEGALKSNSATAAQFAKCLGELGAIDPAKFDISLKSAIEFSEETSPEDLAIDVVTKFLVKVVFKDLTTGIERCLSRLSASQ